MAEACPRLAVERATRSIAEGAELLDAFRREGVPLPGRPLRRPPQGAEGTVSIFYSDLEPDDAVAVACLQQRPSVAAPPVVVFTCELSDTDAGGIFAKKLALSTAILGQDFAEELLVVAGDGLPPPPPPFLAADPLGLAAARALARAAEGGLRLEVVLLAPGRGNVARLLAALRARPEWPEASKRMAVSIYSGSFNIRGCTADDIAAVAEMVQASGRPLLDVAHFVWTRADALKQLRDLPSLLPDLDSRLAAHNPYVFEAWLAFGLEFNADLVKPTGKKLWAKGAALTEEEQAAFAEASALFDAGDVQGYCRKLAGDEALLGKVAHFKQNTLACLASGALDGPLCDCLIYLTGWAREHAPELVSFENEGIWTVDSEKGFTCIAAAGPLCPAVQPTLAAGAGEEAAARLARALLKGVLATTSLAATSPAAGPLPSVTTWMMPRLPRA